MEIEAIWGIVTFPELSRIYSRKYFGICVLQYATQAFPSVVAILESNMIRQQHAA
jgi:hypothetical protein